MRLLAWCAWCAVWLATIASTAGAQSMSVDGDRAAPPPPPPSVAPPAPAAPVPVPVQPPQALSTPITYPETGKGEQEVVLELVVSKEGKISDARVVSGATPFLETALAASKAWRFQPARRGEQNIAAKIRFAVRFVPPPPEPEAQPEPARATPAAKAPAAPVREILVVGQREPIRKSLGKVEVHDMPGAFGDPYRAIESLPGVTPIVSGLPYFYVRGAPPGNIGYFFDGIPVPYLYHFAAGPGVLHPGFVERVDLYPGAYPARYGRYAGAIVAGEMAPPSYRFRGEASVRLIDSGALVEAPFAGGRGSVMVGGRYSYTGAVLSLIVPNVTLNYWDYQARVRYDLDAKNSLEILSFGAGDFLSEKESEYSSSSDGFARTERENTIVDVGFHRFDLRWDRQIEGGRFRNALLLGLDRTGGDDGRLTVRNHLIGLRSEYQRALSRTLAVRAGADSLFESLTQDIDNQGQGGPTDPTTRDDDDPDFGFDRSRRDFTGGVWGDVVIGVAPKLEVTPGIRADLFVSGGRVALAIDPRISARYALTSKLTVTHGLALVHQAPSFVVPVPGFKPSLRGGLQTALQYSAGVSYGLPLGFESSVGLFQNAFFRMTDLISLLQLQNTTNQDETDFRSTGHAYGLELMLKRNLAHDLGGFVSYTLSRSVRSAGNLEGPATTDRTHVLNVALSGNLGRNWRLGGRWLFYSGIPTRVVYVQAAQSPPRTPPFWRLDVKLQKRWYIKAPDAWWGIVFEVLNTTLNKEILNGNCSAFTCTYESIGPVTVPSIGVEGAF